MWSTSFEGFWLLARRNTAALTWRRSARNLACDDVRVAADRLSALLIRDIGLAERCGCDDGGGHGR